MTARRPVVDTRRAIVVESGRWKFTIRVRAEALPMAAAEATDLAMAITTALMADSNRAVNVNG